MENDRIYKDCLKILEIERSKSVLKYSYKSIELWPWIRRCILDSYLKQRRGIEIKSIKKNNLLNLKLFATHLLILIRSKRRFNTQLKELNIEKTQVLIADQQDDYIDKFNNRSYNRYCDPFYEILKKTKKITKITTTTDSTFNPLYPSLTIHCEELLLYNYSKYYLLSFFTTKSIRKIFMRLARDLNLTIDLTFCVNNFIKVLAYEHLFLKVLSKSKPKVVFFKMFYSIENMGLTLAAKKLGIKVVDIQHGKNGKYNHMMSCWSIFPKNGYKLLPDFFWTWGDFFSNNITEYFPKELIHHQTISGGNIWLSKCIHEKPFQLNSDQSLFLKKIQSKRCILFALQPLGKENTIPKWMVNVIAANHDLFWLIRRHPRQSKEDVNYRGIEKMKNVNIDYASSLPLSILLKNCCYNVTLWSSVCIDALEFNIRSAIIHPEGFKIYECEIKDKIFDYCTNEINLTLALNKRNMVKVNNKKMISDFDSIEQNLNGFTNGFFKTT